MTNSNKGLPRFKRPPVVETVLGVHFRPLEKFNSVYQGLLWERCFRERFPELEERPQVEAVQERFGEERLAPPALRWQVSNRPPAPRLWVASENGEHVIQIQKDALFANWLKTDDAVAYRPYSERRQEFSQQLRQVEGFFREEEIGQLEPTSWCVTYINHIDYEGLDNVGPAVARTLTVWTNQFSDDFLHSPDNLTFSLAFPMPENTGRLNATFKPVVRKDKRQALHLDLTARGQLETRDLTSALSAIDLGHEWVVRGFASLTRPEMHQVWERMQ